MTRSFAWIPAFAGMTLALTPAPLPRAAARVDDVRILLREIDASSQAKIDKLHDELRALVAATVDRLIDDRVCTGTLDSTTTPVPITDEAVRAFRQSRPDDFMGGRGSARAAQTTPATIPDPATDTAIRHFLEQQARADALAEACRRRRQGHAVEHLLPAAETFDAPLPDDHTLARIDRKPLRAADVERAAALRLYRLRGEIFRERQRNLTAAIDHALLASEAARRKTSLPALEAELATLLPITDAALDAFIENERVQGRPVPARERVRPYLEFQEAHARRAALLEQLRAAARIELLLTEPTVPRLPVEEAGAPTLGPAAGPRIVVYSNYRCRPCRAAHRELDRFRAIHPKVRLVFRDFVPVYDPVATEAAQLTRCAATLGAFAAMRDILLTRDPPSFGTRWYPDDTLPDLARKIGVDPQRFIACAHDTTVGAQIDRDTAHARTLGFDEAPAFVVEGIPLSGMQSAEGLVEALHGR